MTEKPFDLNVQLGEFSFVTSFAGSGDLLHGGSSMLFEEIPQAVAQGLLSATMVDRKLIFPIKATSAKFTLEVDIRILVIGYDAPEDRHYLVFDIE